MSPATAAIEVKQARRENSETEVIDPALPFNNEFACDRLC
jgi:hypothetical protein